MSHVEQFEESEQKWFSFFLVSIHFASQNYIAEEKAESMNRQVA